MCSLDGLSKLYSFVICSLNCVNVIVVGADDSFIECLCLFQFLAVVEMIYLLTSVFSYILSANVVLTLGCLLSVAISLAS